MIEAHAQPEIAQPENPAQPAANSGVTAGLKMVPQICCVCGFSDVHPVGVGEDFEYRTSADTFVAVRCLHCGLIHLDPRPDEAELPRIYPANYHAFAFEAESYGLVWRVRSWLETRRLLRSLKGLPADARILDVGCGDGFHLRLLQNVKNKRWELEGLDSDERAVKGARDRGLKVEQGRIEDNHLPATHYDLLLLIMTLEHIAHPVESLAAMRRLLKPNGRLVVITDNTRTPHFWAFRNRHWGGYHFPRHWNLFHAGNLSRAAERAGFEVDEISTELNPVNWVYSIHNWLADWGAPAWLRRRFTLRSVGALAVFTLIDGFFNLLGHGAILRAVLRNPEAESNAEAKPAASASENQPIQP